MLISLGNKQKDHLQFLATQPTQVLIDFCKLTLDFLQSGPNQQLEATVSENLSINLDAVQNGVYGLVNLFLCRSKEQLGEACFRDVLVTLGFSSIQQDVICKFYESRRSAVDQVLSELSKCHTRYNNLEWRFEVQVATRALLHQVTPLIVLDLSLKSVKKDMNEYDIQHLVLQTDVNNLLHVTETLEKALKECNGRHLRKIQRALNNR